MPPQEQILGFNYFGPVEGTPLLPPEILTYYFIFFTLALVIAYFYLYRKRRPTLLSGKLNLFLLTALAIKLVVVTSALFLAAYWLIPTPGIQSTSPSPNETSFPANQKIEIIFDRPISRSQLEKSITPDIPGVWLFDDSLYTTHLYRKLVFHPTITFQPSTPYTIELKHLKNISRLSPETNYSFSFNTQPLPQVTSVVPADHSQDISIQTPIQVLLDQPHSQISQFEFTLDPPHPVDIAIDPAQKTYTLTPQTPFTQNTAYKLTVFQTHITTNLPQNYVTNQSDSKIAYQSTFTTQPPPGIAKFLPQEASHVLPDTAITLIFSEDMDQNSVEENFYITPRTSGQLKWTDNRTLTFTPTRLKYATEYTVTVKSGTLAQDRSFVDQEIAKSFKTIGPPEIAHLSPEDGWLAADIVSPIKITFDQAVDQPLAESKFSLEPQVSGHLAWQDKTLIFTPSQPFPYSTQFTITLSPGIKNVLGLATTQSFTSTFTTQQQTTKLSAPPYLQRYSLSCEAAALRIALAAKGVQTSEDQLLAQIGLDPTPHQGNIWGNPHSAFVGNVRGRQMVDGYGVHWSPIARTARNYRPAEEFTNWSLRELTQAIAAGHPAVLWVYAGRGTPTSWMTPDGQNIYAVRDEHAVTAVGFVGPADNPSQIIINDPLVGQVYWPRALFDKKWNIFNRSAVVVY